MKPAGKRHYLELGFEGVKREMIVFIQFLVCVICLCLSSLNCHREMRIEFIMSLEIRFVASNRTARQKETFNSPGITDWDYFSTNEICPHMTTPLPHSHIILT